MKDIELILDILCRHRERVELNVEELNMPKTYSEASES